MYAPTARTTHTRLPWWWPLLAMWVLMALWSPAFATNVEAHTPATAGADEPLRLGSWQLLTMPQMWRAVQERSASGAPRLLPLAVMPTERGAWLFGFSAARAGGGPRVELRFTMPLDGSRLVLPHQRDAD